MDLEQLKRDKETFALSQSPPIAPCTNQRCMFRGCTCGEKCGCNIPPEEAEGKELQGCDPCAEFKAKKAAEKAQAEAGLA
mmetsp:Transcript_5997/g.12516  ORF Transcript_5997/g.12516 Transcript_5997/m.12516 type:complete len:80 (+) Transcript_5997:59-298(+)